MDKEKLRRLIEQGHDYYYSDAYNGTSVYEAIAEYLIMKDVRLCGHKTNMPQTNADRIRSMSDEELAECLYEIGYAGGWFTPEGTLKWLQQPAEDVDNG